MGCGEQLESVQSRLGPYTKNQDGGMCPPFPHSPRGLPQAHIHKAAFRANRSEELLQSHRVSLQGGPLLGPFWLSTGSTENSTHAGGTFPSLLCLALIWALGSFPRIPPGVREPADCTSGQLLHKEKAQPWGYPENLPGQTFLHSEQ